MAPTHPLKDNPRLIILSDLWGFQNCPWIDKYTEVLKDDFELGLCDCRELGEVDLKSTSQDLIHSQFVQGVIDKAVENLVAQEQGEVHLLAFSVGGTIGWKAVASGLKVISLTAVSATRLRHENSAIDCELSLYFGEDDEFKPGPDWLKNQSVEVHTIKGHGHKAYMDTEVIHSITTDLKGRLLKSNS